MKKILIGIIMILGIGSAVELDEGIKQFLLNENNDTTDCTWTYPKNENLCYFRSHILEANKELETAQNLKKQGILNDEEYSKREKEILQDKEFYLCYFIEKLGEGELVYTNIFTLKTEKPEQIDYKVWIKKCYAK